MAAVDKNERIADTGEPRATRAHAAVNSLNQRLHALRATGTSTKPKCMFIPQLRGLRPLGNPDQSLMSARTRKDYGIEDGFTGESLYDSLRRHLLGTHAQRLRVAAFEQFLGRTFFSGSDITIIPRHDADVVNVRIGSDPECNIYDLGDGVQHCIVLFAPLYFGDFDKTGLALFVEEPDLFLHPGYQRLWVRAILEWNDYPLQVSCLGGGAYLRWRDVAK